MNLKEILEKPVEELTDDEKEFLNENVESISDEDKEKFAEILEGEEGDETLDEDEAKAFLSRIAKEAVGEEIEEASEKISKQMVNKFQSMLKEGVGAKRKVISGKEGERKEEKEEDADTVTRKFMTALRDGDTNTLKAMTTADDDTPKAGYTIPDELLAEVLRFANQYGVARSKMRYLPFSGAGNSRQIPKLSSALSVYWIGEGASKKSSEPGFGLVEQTLKKLAVIVPMTEELLEDTAVPITELVGELVGEALSLEEDTQFLAGSGSPWTGVLNNSSVNEVVMGSGDTFSDIDADDLLDMQDELTEAQNRGAEYLMNRTVFSRVRRLKDDNGNYIVQNPVGDTPATIWDRPYTLSDAMPATSESAADTPFVIYGNLGKCAIFGDKGDVRFKILEEATITDTDGETKINLAEQDMLGIRVVSRVGYVLGLPEGIAVLKTAEASS